MAKKVGFSQLVIESDSESELEDVSDGPSLFSNSHLDECSHDAESISSGNRHGGSIVNGGSLANSKNSSKMGGSQVSHISNHSESAIYDDRGGSKERKEASHQNVPYQQQFGLEHNTLQSLIDSKDYVIKGMENRLCELENQLHDRDQRLSKVEGELYQCDQSRMRIQEESRKHMRRICDLDGELAILEKSKHQLNQIIKDQKETIDDLEEKLFRDRSDKAPVQYESLLSEIKELRSKVKSLEAHRDSKHLMNEKLSKQIEDMSGNDARLQDVIAKCMRDLASRNERIVELTEQCSGLQQKLNEMNNPENTIQSLQSAIGAVRDELSSVQQKSQEEIGAREDTIVELKDRLLLMNMELEDQQRIIDAYTADEDIITVANCLKELRVKDKNFYDFFMALVMWECNPQIPATDRGVVMDVQDAIRLIEKGLLSMRIVLKCQNRREQGAYLRYPPSMHGKPLWSDSVSVPSKAYIAPTADKMRQDNCDCAVRILDFMDQHQIMEVAKYLCSTPLLAEWALAQQVLDTPPIKQKKRPGIFSCSFCVYRNLLSCRDFSAQERRP